MRRAEFIRGAAALALAPSLIEGFAPAGQPSLAVVPAVVPELVADASIYVVKPQDVGHMIGCTITAHEGVWSDATPPRLDYNWTRTKVDPHQRMVTA